jgi:hypothetical protein
MSRESDWERLCREADERLAKQPKKPDRDLPDGWNDMSIGELWERLNDPKRHGVAKSMLEAADYLFGAKDPKRFEHWLLQHRPAERTAIVAHIDKRRGRS